MLVEYEGYDQGSDVSLSNYTGKSLQLKTSNRNNNENIETKNFRSPKSTEQFYHVNLDTLLELKDSTKKLLCVIEEIRSKSDRKDRSDINLYNYLGTLHAANDLGTVTDSIGAKAIQRLETQAQALDSNYKRVEEDDCSIYKRLTRKCHCFNRIQFNDFIIHFNEDTKSCSIAGEIIKNLRVLKKFLYLSGTYSKNALIFLNEGLTDSTYAEKSEIIQGCAYADMCNVFEDASIVAVYISWPCKNWYYGDSETQALAAGFLYKISQLEEGRRYLNYSSKITIDIKRLLKKKSNILEFETVENLKATLNLLNPPLLMQNLTYHCTSVDDGLGKKTMNSLIYNRHYLTLEEIFTHLALIQNISYRENGKIELANYLPALLNLFNRMLVEYDNSEMNILITNILNNVLAQNNLKVKEDMHDVAPKTMIIADIATEPVKMKNGSIQHPPKKNIPKKGLKSKVQIELGLAPNKYRNPSKRTGINRNSIIIVPMEKESQ